MAVTTTNLGVITAYGDAVAAGYTGTKAEWQALMASYATVGQQAVDAKNAAVAAKDTAVAKATEATTAANTATTKASEASASAQSIAQSASQIQENTDDITQLKSEFTAVDAELADVRVGADGVTYNSAGAAVRGQISGIKSDLKPLYTSDMEQGTLSAVNFGQPLRLADSTYVIRQKEFSSWTAGMKVSVKDGYQARLMLCDSDGGFITDASWSQTVTHNNTTATKVKVLIKNVDSSATLTPDEAVSVVVYSDIPIINIKPKANVEDVDNLETELLSVDSSISSLKEYANTLYVYNHVPVTLETGIYDRYSGSSTVGKHASITVEAGEKYIVVAGCYNSSDYPICLFRKNGAIVGFKNIASSQMEQTEVIVPNDADEMIINTSISYIEIKKGIPVSAKPYSKWHGKKIAWFGTSIPEKSTYNAVFGYPEYTGKLLGATVYNEARGSSCARRGFKSKQSENDPYGWTSMGYKGALYNMASTHEEKQELLDNWDSKWKALVGGDHTLTNGDRTLAMYYSYETVLQQHIDNPVDLYVFDHGYNDWSNNETDMAMNENDPFDRSTYQGALNTFIKLILTANPRAKILLLSHYETQERPTLVPMQEAVAKYWNLPFCRICDYLGWANDRTIETDGYWSNGTGNGVWIDSGGTSRTINLKQYHMPDGRHPNIDISGHACMDIAEIIADFIDHISPSN